MKKIEQLANDIDDLVNALKHKDRFDDEIVGKAFQSAWVNKFRETKAKVKALSKDEFDELEKACNLRDYLEMGNGWQNEQSDFD